MSDGLGVMLRAAIVLFVIWNSASAAYGAAAQASTQHQGHSGHQEPPQQQQSQGQQKPDAPAQGHPSHQPQDPAPYPPGKPPATGLPPITDEDRKAAFPELNGQHTVHDDAVFTYVLFDQLEWQTGDGVAGLTWDTKGWIGGDVNRFWFRTEGEAEDGDLGEAEAHGLYGRAIARWWDLVLGVRQDQRPGPAPYVGVTWNRKFFGTADLARAEGEDTSGARFALGARVWF